MKKYSMTENEMVSDPRSINRIMKDIKEIPTDLR